MSLVPEGAMSPAEVDSGQPPPTPPPAQSPPPAPPAPPIPRRHRFMFWTAILAALACLGGGGYLAFTTYQTSIAPETVVRDYLSALAAGDAARALSYGELPAPSKFAVDPRTLLTDDVLAAQLAVAPMTEIAVTAVHQSGPDAQADVRYTLGFKTGAVTVDDTIPITRDGRSWRLVTPAVRTAMFLELASGRASLAGAVVPRGTYFLFPGAMPIVFDTDVVELAPDSRVVSFSTAGSEQSQHVEVSAAGKQAFGAAIDAALKTCLDGDADEPTLCPVPSDYRAVPGTMRGTLTTPAVDKLRFTVQPGAEGNLLAMGDLSIDGTYEQLDFNNRRVSKDVEDAVTITVLSNALNLDQIIWEFL